MALALGDVEHGADEAQGVALAVLLQPTLDPDPALPAIGPADAHLQVHRPAARQGAPLRGLQGSPVIGVHQCREPFSVVVAAVLGQPENARQLRRPAQLAARHVQLPAAQARHPLGAGEARLAGPQLIGEGALAQVDGHLGPQVRLGQGQREVAVGPGGEGGIETGAGSVGADQRHHREAIGKAPLAQLPKELFGIEARQVKVEQYQGTGVLRQPAPGAVDSGGHDPVARPRQGRRNGVIPRRPVEDVKNVTARGHVGPLATGDGVTASPPGPGQRSVARAGRHGHLPVICGPATQAAPVH